MKLLINFFNHQILAALSVSIGSMVVGFASAYTSPALVSMTDNTTTPFEVTEQEVSKNLVMEFSHKKKKIVSLQQ